MPLATRYSQAAPGAPVARTWPIKGVIADEMRFERGLTRATMSLQARWEARHMHRADRVIATSLYCADWLKEFYRLVPEPAIVPKLIDLAAWRQLLRHETVTADPARFVVLCVAEQFLAELRKLSDRMSKSAHSMTQSA